MCWKQAERLAANLSTSHHGSLDQCDVLFFFLAFEFFPLSSAKKLPFASPSERVFVQKRFIWKWVWFAWKWKCSWNTFHMNGFARPDSFWHRGKRELGNGLLTCQFISGISYTCNISGTYDDWVLAGQIFVGAKISRRNPKDYKLMFH